jgi:hypothetical protein
MYTGTLQNWCARRIKHYDDQHRCITNPPLFKVVFGNKTDNPNQYPGILPGHNIYNHWTIRQHSLSIIRLNLNWIERNHGPLHFHSRPSTEYTRPWRSIAEDQAPGLGRVADPPRSQTFIGNTTIHYASCSERYGDKNGVTGTWIH